MEDCDHPFIAKLYGTFNDKARIYSVFEVMDGRSTLQPSANCLS